MRLNTHPHEWAYFSQLASELIPKKNLQLDYDANRRILLIGNTCYMASDEVITGAFNQFIDGASALMSNIDEIYVDFSVNQFERIYCGPRAQPALGADSP